MDRRAGGALSLRSEALREEGARVGGMSQESASDVLAEKEESSEAWEAVSSQREERVADAEEEEEDDEEDEEESVGG